MNFFSLSNGLRLYYYNVHTPNNGMITAVYKKAFDVHFSMPFSLMRIQSTGMQFEVMQTLLLLLPQPFLCCF